MFTLLRLLWLVVLLVTAVQGQGSRGGGSSGGSRGGGGSRTSYNRGGTCSGSGCRTAGIIAGSVIGGVLSLLAIIFLTIFCCRRCRGRPSQSNADFVNLSAGSQTGKAYEIYEEDLFKNGDYSSRYHQYGVWHGPHQMSLTFDRSEKRVIGHGFDDIGKFTVDGTFSPENQRMALTKTYEAGTGNSKENFGHTVTIQLTWNPTNNQYEGKWYIHNDRYHGEDNYELKFDKF